MQDSDLSPDNRVDFTTGQGIALYREFVAQATILPGSAAIPIPTIILTGQVRASMEQLLVDSVVEPPLGEIVFEVLNSAAGLFSAEFPVLTIGRYWYSILVQRSPGAPQEIWCWGSITIEAQPTEIVEAV